ncbi:MAG: hypothetical protein R3Y07_05480 [Eubacteriales bacterium]
MFDILITSLGLVAIIAVGYIFKKQGKFSLRDKDFLGKVLVEICLPCVIISIFEDFTYDPSFFFVCLLGFLLNVVTTFVGYLTSRKNSRNLQAQKMLLSGGYNIAIFALPFISSFFSSTAVITAIIFDMGNAVMVLGGSMAVASALINHEKGNPIFTILKNIVHSVPCMCYLAMALFQVFGITLPPIVYQLVDVPARATAFLGMLMIGIMIDFNFDKNQIKDALSIIGLRYGLSVTVAILCYLYLPMPLEVRQGLFLGMVSPIATSSIIYTQQLGADPMQVGFVSTLAIFVSIAIMIGAVIVL